MHTIAAYFQNGDFAGADTLLNGVQDQSVTVNGDDIRVPPGMSNLLAEAILTPAATRTMARVETPSLRPLANQDVPIFFNAATGLSDAIVNFHPYDPRPLEVDESVNFNVNTDDAAAQDHYGVIWLGDGPQQVVGGKIFTVRLTATITQVAGVWTAGQMTFTQRLPVTDYQVVGMRCIAASGIAARLVFAGSPWRPGVLVANNTQTTELYRFRQGNMGVFGTFNINQPPQLEVLAGTATAQTVFLDLIRVK